MMTLKKASPTPQAPDLPAEALPLTPAELELWLGRACRQLVAGRALPEVLSGLCRGLGELPGARLVTISRRLETGACALECSSAESPLWLELQRIPERWDTGIASDGPAGLALRTGAPLQMPVRDGRFALWAAAAEAAGVRQLAAFPFGAAGGSRVLTLYHDGRLLQAAGAGRVPVAALTRELAALIADDERLTRQRLLAAALESAGNAAFITDLNASIVWSNRAFGELTGYAPAEALGRNPRFLQSGAQSLRYYRDLWSTIRAGRVWSGETVDRDRDGNPYTIQQTISPVAQDGRVSHYLSVHQDISRQKHEQAQLERRAGAEAGTGLLTRAGFADEVTAHVAAGAPGALVLIELPGLKRALATLDAGTVDLIAAEQSRNLAAALPEPRLAARLSAAEYALWMSGSPDEAALAQALQQMRGAINEPLPLLGDSVRPDARFGVARYPQQGATFDALRLSAERALADAPLARARRTVQP